MVSLEIVSLVIFAVIMGLLLLKDRKNVTFNKGIVVRRWTKGVDIIDRIVNKYPRLMRRLGNIGIFTGLVAGIGGIIILIILTIKLQQTFGLVLPTAGGYQIPGPVISVPFWYWIIAIFIIAASHETMHAVFIRMEKVPLKNYGILMLLFLPIGAFVDPDTKKMNKLSIMKKLRIFAAGSFANFATGIIAILLFTSGLAAFGSLSSPSGVSIQDVAGNSPAFNLGLHGTITTINGNEIKTGSDFIKAFNNTSPGDVMNVVTDKGVYDITLGKNPQDENRSYLGVSVKSAFDYNLFGLNGSLSWTFIKIYFTFLSFLNWLFVISFGVGIVNMLPAKPLDGGLFFGEIFEKLFGKNGKMIINIMSVVILFVILFNLFGIKIVKSIIG